MSAPARIACARTGKPLRGRPTKELARLLQRHDSRLARYFHGWWYPPDRAPSLAARAALIRLRSAAERTLGLFDRVGPSVASARPATTRRGVG